MNKIYISFLTFICCSCINALTAQILSVAPGTAFAVKAGTKMVAERVDFNFSGNFTLTNNTLNVNLLPNKITGISTMQRMYTFTNTVDNLYGRIGLNYLESELNGIAESDLKFLYNNGTGWVDDYNSIVNTGINLLDGGPLNYSKFHAFLGGKYLAAAEVVVVKVYPNPSAAEFNVMVMASGVQEIELRIIDMRGTVIETKKTSPYQNVKMGRILLSGTYIIRAVQGNKPIAAIKVVKL